MTSTKIIPLSQALMRSEYHGLPSEVIDVDGFTTGPASDTTELTMLDLEREGVKITPELRAFYKQRVTERNAEIKHAMSVEEVFAETAPDG